MPSQYNTIMQLDGLPEKPTDACLNILRVIPSTTITGLTSGMVEMVDV